MWGLGRVFDIGVGINPVADLAAGANTGKRIHMRNYECMGFLFFKNPASAGTDTITLTLKEHNANTGGTSQALAKITTWYKKSTAAALAGTEAWTETTQAAASTLALDNTALPAANQAMVFFEIDAAQLSDGFQWLSVDIADPGSGGTILGGLFYIANGLRRQRRADLLAQPNA